MNQQRYHVIGVMSGTSLDGIDLCDVEFWQDGQWHYHIHNTTTIPYDEDWKSRLQTAIDLDAKAIEQLDDTYTTLLAQVVSQFIKQYSITSVDAICSHGHTVFHQPNAGLTVQIGNTPELAHQLNLPVVCDFRVQDVALGGQGAPLVPIGDALLFPAYSFCMNLGGFANISFDYKGKRLAFDITAINSVCNHYANQLGSSFDNEGKWAAEGCLSLPLYTALNSLEYYNEPPPKSLGLEWVRSKVLPLIDSYDLDAKSVLRTVVEHMAYQMASVLKTYSLDKGLFTGGGVYNTFLRERLEVLSWQFFEVHDSQLIEFKEALIFGFLGVLRLRNEVNCWRSVTGASHDHSSGKIILP
jgi:anhydro-N-acetylmuramic acid kinase